MATTGILRPDEVVFYHPLDNLTEHTQSQIWTGTAGFVPGKLPTIPVAFSAVTADAFAFSAEVEFEPAGIDIPSGAARAMSVKALNSTTIALAYLDAGDAKLLLGDVSGSNVSFGSVITIDTNGQSANIAVLSSSKILVSYRNAASGGKCVVVTISGLDATLGAAFDYSVGGPKHTDIETVALTASKVLITWIPSVSGNNATVNAIVATVSGTDVTFGSPVTDLLCDRDQGYDIDILDSGRVVIVYADAADAFKGKGKVITVSGTDITFGPASEFNAVTTIVPSCAALTATTVVAAYQTSLRGRASVGTVSGTDITWAAEVEFRSLNWSAGAGESQTVKLDSTHVAISIRADGGSGIEGGRSYAGTVSGADITFGAESSWHPGNVNTTLGPRNMRMASYDASHIIVVYRDNNDSDHGTARIGALDVAADLEAPTPGAYPAATGNDRVVVAMWANKLGAGSSTVTVERDYTVAFTATTIALGPATATWSDGAIGTLMSTMAGGEHFLVLDFEHTGGDSWTLKTSLDGGAFVPQGAEDSGSRSTAPASLAPGLSIADGASGQWIDELVMWAGDKSAFESFETQELANLFDLADTFCEAMNQFEENFGAPLCWQATARMPDGSVWRDSGSGSCPPVVRVPIGADDIVVTDDGGRVSPRIIEG